MPLRLVVGLFVILAFPIGAGTTAATMQSRGTGATDQRAPALRPAVAGPHGGVSTGHPLTTAAAFEVLLKGGNAFDARVAALIVGGVVEQDLYSLGGEALVLVYPKKEDKVTSVVGQGWAPKAVDVDWFTSRGKTLSGAGLDPAVVPGALHAALTVLEKWGTMSFADVSARAVQ
jgi:gamma-glutamyltranspeptidase/glutathione hydrolase